MTKHFLPLSMPRSEQLQFITGQKSGKICAGESNVITTSSPNFNHGTFFSLPYLL
jgi:hypothetical protein